MWALAGPDNDETRQRWEKGGRQMAQDYTELMNQLKDQKIDQFEIGPEEFPAFQQAFMAFDTRKRIIGQAHKGGKIIYRYDHDVANGDA